MCVSFIILLFLQLRYINEMNKMRHQEFDESVKRSLYEVAYKLELAEAKRYLEEDLREMDRNSAFNDISVDGFYGQFTFSGGGFSLLTPLSLLLLLQLRIPLQFQRLPCLRFSCLARNRIIMMCQRGHVHSSSVNWNIILPTRSLLMR